MSAASAHARFGDTGSFARVTGWDLDFRQLDPGPVEIRARLLAGTYIDVLGMQFTRGFHQRGVAPRGRLTFGIPLAGLRDWRGRPIGNPGLVDFNHASGLDCVSTRNFAGVTLSVNEDYLHQVSETFRLPPYHQPHHPTPAGIIPQSHVALSLRKALISDLDGSPERFDEEHESHLVVQLLTALAVASEAKTRSKAPVRSRAVAIAVEYIEDHRREPVTVGDICASTGVSWRTLDRAFRERFGIGPKAYSMRRRLEGARGDLLRGSRGVRISDVANAWGFWHLGQFARDYKGLFGELPSDTACARTAS